MTVSPLQIIQAQAQGLVNVMGLAAACDKLKFPFHLACAILDKETDGRNIYGHDVGGIFTASDGRNVEVTESNYAEFLRRLAAGERSNGVGPLQLTWRGYHIGPDSMTARGLKAWVPADDILYGVEILAKSYQANVAKGMTPEAAFWATAKAYNGNDSYADDAVVKARTWAATVGSSDMEAPVATERLPLYGRLTCIDLIRILPLVEYRFMLKGWIRQDFDGLIFQLTYGPPVAASSNTHVSGAVLDVAWRLVDSDAKVRVWRECGVIMHPRPEGTIRNVQAHGHGCAAGCPHLSQEAQEQVDDYRTHFGNGLLNDRQALGPHVPYITYQNALKKYAALVEDMNMPTAKEIIDELIRRGPEVGAAIGRGYLRLDDTVPAGKDEPNPANTHQVPATFIKGDHDLLVDIREALTKPVEPPPA